MASSKDYLDYILEQLGGAEDISSRAMMGEYIIYCQGKVIGGIYDNRFLVKPTASAKALMPDRLTVYCNPTFQIEGFDTTPEGVAAQVQDFIDKALEDSSYGEDDPAEKWFLIGFALLFIGGIFLVIYVAIASALGYKWKKSIFGRTKIDGWYRDIPLDGNLFAAEYALTKGARFGSNTPAQNIIGAFFLHWIMDGKLKVQPDPKSDKRVNLVFEADTASMDDVEEDLFQWALSAAGDNRILEKNEFEKWSTKNYKKMTAWPERAIARGKTWFRNKGYFLSEGTCTTEGQQQACHLIEFRNFLKDFTLSGERASNEVSLWKDYLVFAQLFGIAEKVAKQFKKLYPSVYEEVARSTGMDSDHFTYMVLWTNNMSTRSFGNAIAKAGNINGTGGHASFGGGGGFSGGGFGGGGR